MGERRANATMFSQQPRSGSRWEKESQRAIFPIVSRLHEVAMNQDQAFTNITKLLIKNLSNF
jgi:hypothetical protein